MYQAKVICDSVAENVRLTTLEVTLPRIVLAEFNTHRSFCLAGDAELEFDLPGGGAKGRRVYRMRIDEFVDKWHNGARRTGANPKTERDLSGVSPARYYAAPYVASMLGMANPSNLHAACRAGTITARRDGRTWMIGGSEVLRWRAEVPAHTRFDMRARLSQMQIRQLNEDTGDIQVSRVVNACESGTKRVFEVQAGDFTVAGSADHRIMTTGGWKTIGELRAGDSVLARKFGKADDDRSDPNRLRKYLYAAAVAVDAIVDRGEEKTYDLEIAGAYPNFIANGVVVHNSRNSSSSRAIPVEKRIAAIRANPFVPDAFARNQKGMQPGDELSAEETDAARTLWHASMLEACDKAAELASIGVHKQWANRIIEPYSWTTIVVTATEWENYDNLRISSKAQHEIRTAATLMKEARDASKPVDMRFGEWHLPYILIDELADRRLSIETLVQVSAARCARVSYLTQSGVRDIAEDLALYARLFEGPHFSPMEHVARVDLMVPERLLQQIKDSGYDPEPMRFVGNFRRPWLQHRKMLAGEAVAPKEESDVAYAADAPSHTPDRNTGPGICRPMELCGHDPRCKE